MGLSIRVSLMPLLEYAVQLLVPHNAIDRVVESLLFFFGFVAHKVCNANEAKARAIFICSSRKIFFYHTLS